MAAPVEEIDVAPQPSPELFPPAEKQFTTPDPTRKIR